MNKKQTGIISGLLGAGLVLGLGLMINDYYQEKERQHITRDLRAFFSELGHVDVLYITPKLPRVAQVSGGVVMADGRHYTYTYDSGQISVKEERI